MATVVLLLLAVGAFLALGIARAPMWAWAAAVGVLTLIGQSGALNGAEAAGQGASILSWLAWLPFVALALLSIPSLRRSLVVAPVFDKVRTILPKVSDTEPRHSRPARSASMPKFFPELPTGTSCGRPADPALGRGTGVPRRADA